MAELRNIRIVAAVVEAHGDVLLVHQQGPSDPQPVWSLPGGRVEPGESLVEALKRELLEETGLTLDESSPTLLYITEIYDSHDAMHAIASVFRVRVLPDTAPISDPDGYILEARFVPTGEAVTLISQNPYLPGCEPTLSYLRGNHITFWSYTVSPLGMVERVLPV